MGYKHSGCFSEEHRQNISEALKKAGIKPPSRKGVYKTGKPFDRKAYMKKYNAKYYVANIELHRAKSIEWNRKNGRTDKTRLRNRIWLKRKLKEDLNFRLASLLRRRIYTAVKLQAGEKAYKTMELIGCSVNKLMRHFELQFRDGMNWNNYGLYGWHIDHIKPLSSFDLKKKSEQRKAFHYTNLQPLLAIENLKKSNKMI